MKFLCASTKCKYSSENEDSSHIMFINFPNDNNAKIWARNCDRPDLMMKSNEDLHMNYYICSHHIKDQYYVQKSNEVIIEQSAIPTFFEEELSPEKNNDMGIYGRNEPVEGNDHVGLAYCDMNVEIDQYDHGITIRFANLCRLCGEPKNDGTDIFSEKGLDLRLKEKINLLMPIIVDLEDLMPQKVCMDCYNKLEIAHSLVANCLRTDLKLRRFLNVDNTQQYDSRFHRLVEECSLELNKEICMDDETVRNVSASFSNDKIGEIVGAAEISSQIIENETRTDLEQVQIIAEETMLESNNIENLNNLINTYREEQTSTGNIITTVQEDFQGNKGVDIVCVHCKDTFKTHEIFENHKILCDGEVDINLGQEKNVSALREFHLMITCEICQQVFETKESFEQHQLNCHNSSNQICHTIEELSSHINNENFDKEEANYQNQSKRCGHCNDVFTSRKDLLTHITNDHNGDQLFKCYVCDRSYKKWSSLDVHEATHRKDKPYLCDLCGKSFKHSNNLRGHKRIHLDESQKKRHSCDVCEKSFRSRFHLREHMNQHSGNKPYSCEKCGKAFFKRIQLRQHTLSHGTNKYSCPICGISFNRRGNMNTHLKRHSNGDGLYTCSVCSYKCNTMSELKMHRKKHTEYDIRKSISTKSASNKIWECNVCNKVFPSQSVYQLHERKHTGERPCIECTDCGKKLSSKSSLLYHKKAIHSKERPHMCQYCGVSFISKEARLIHERIHTGERPYTCNICGMQYRCSSNLSQHSKIHLKIKPHKCHFCNKSFTRKGALSVHERIHIGLKPFACETCGRKFSQKNDMLKHTKTHDIKSIQCQQCDEVFSSKRDLIKHITLHEQNSITDQEYIEVSEQLQSYIINIPCPDI
ncbi:zinc finger protein 93-like [Prorops nasuta]|uniref:zinc finger protein 93-like n=1 Tax=Prorops nasuta TaxID=863751 RepID=UPI0034CF2908